jgi:tetratricopeptide (TPR) repeat protein
VTEVQIQVAVPARRSVREDCCSCVACMGCLVLVAAMIAAASLFGGRFSGRRAEPVPPTGKPRPLLGRILGGPTGEERNEARRQFRRGMEIASRCTEVDEAEKAALCFERAVELDPDFHEARFNLAMVYEGVGRLGDAEDVLMELARRRRSYPGLQEALIRIRAEQSQPERFPQGGNL